MKKIMFAAFIISLLAISCSDDDPVVNPGSDPYMSTTVGNEWVYEDRDSAVAPPDVSTYTVTSSNRDTVVSGRTYHVYDNSDGTYQYFNISGSDYYQLMPLPDPIGIVENNYLRDNASVGTNWVGVNKSTTIDFGGTPVPITVTMTNSVTERGISRIVNGVTYNDVIHVSSTLNISSIVPVTIDEQHIDSYYAPRYGLIENHTEILVSMAGLEVNTTTRLQSKNF
jgi:hypothetical protein